MSKLLGRVGILMALCVCQGAIGDRPPQTWYVDKSSPVPGGDGSTWATAFRTIHSGINAAFGGDTVVVAEGTYFENIRFRGKNIVLRSRAPEDRSVVESTIIDGNRSGSVVTFEGSEDETCVLSGFTIRHGEADYGGGIHGGDNDQVTRAGIENNIIIGNSSSWGGGLAFCDGTIRDNTISLNFAGYCGGGLYSCTGIIEGNTISANLSTYYGGGIADVRPIRGYADIIGNTISLNTARRGGGLDVCTGVIEGNIISENEATLHGGGGLHGCDGTIRGNIISLNVAAYSGGGLDSCTGIIEGNAISENKATLNTGGGLYGCDGTIRDNAISLNLAEYSGGGLDSCTGIIEDNTIGQNEATLYGGGGLSLCDGTIRNNTIFLNFTGYGGGGLHSCTGTIEGNTISFNYATVYGGGIGGVCLMSGYADIIGNTISLNTAEDGGGLACCAGTIRNNRITGNWADPGSGGGLYGCDADIVGNTISKNTAEKRGGGLHGGAVFDCSGPIISNLILANSCREDGGGIYYGGGAEILNNTIIGNSASRGGGFCLSPTGVGTAIIRNCIFWHNTATEGDQLINSGVGLEPSAFRCCIQGWTGDWEWGENISEAPRFVDADGPDNNPDTYGDNDYRLSAGSPCIDAGDNSGLDPPGLDLDGNLRIAYGADSLTVDIGAYEYNSAPFEITEIARVGKSQVRVTWNSQPYNRCVVSCCSDLSTGTWIVLATQLSKGAVSSWTDGGAFGHMRFYRIEMNP